MDKIRLYLWMCVLTILAGSINAIAIFDYDSTTVSHVTGLVSKVAIAISDGDLSGFWKVFAVILAFFLGAMISGIVTGQRAFYLHKRYGFIIILVGLLILGPLFLKLRYSILLFAFAMGLQNGMVVSFKGVVVRMTHMSGNLTDLGVFVGYKIKGNKNEKAITGIIPGTALLSFVIGGVLGVLLYKGIEKYSFIVISLIYITLGIIYFFYQRSCIDKDFNGIPDELEQEIDEKTI